MKVVHIRYVASTGWYARVDDDVRLVGSAPAPVRSAFFKWATLQESGSPRFEDGEDHAIAAFNASGDLVALGADAVASLVG